MIRRVSRQVNVGGVPVGGSAPISVQTMTKTRTEDVDATVRQISELADLGCDIVRVAVPSREAAEAIASIKKQSPLPIVADVHFSSELALLAIASGAAGIRINPGNIKDKARMRKIAAAARDRAIPIRVGTNSGSVGRSGDGDVARRLVAVCLDCCKALEECEFRDIKVSFKASTCEDTVRAYRMAASMCDYPFHIGMTATGPSEQGLVRSAVAIGTLLLDGIGDTIRVSLTGPPQREVSAAFEILAAVGLGHGRPEIVSCPTCGRCSMDVVRFAEEIKERTSAWPHEITIAVMGCEVNGPGEAREADVGIAGAGRNVLLFVKGNKKRSIEPSAAVDVLLEEAEKIALEKRT